MVEDNEIKAQISPFAIREGEIKTFDVVPYICGSWFGQLKDEAYFQTVFP